MTTKKNDAAGYAIFDSPLGQLGLAWRESGAIARVQLPGYGADAARNVLAATYGEEKRRAPPAALAAVAERLQAHLAGRADPLRDVAVDLSGRSEIARETLAAVRSLPAGQVTTYGALANDLGRPGGARAVGAALARNPVPLIVPCHRVVAADGALTGFTAPGGVALKRRLLALEGYEGPGMEPFAEAVAQLRKKDPTLRRLIDRVGPCRMVALSTGDPFSVLLQSIVHQQLSMQAGQTIWGRVKALLPENPAAQPAAVLALGDDELRGAGLSRTKVAAARDLAARTADGRLQLDDLRELSDEDAVAALVPTRGIGRWTAEMFLMFHLGRPDVLPVGDLGFREGVRAAYDLPAQPTPKEVEALAERWRPYRSVATWYMWRVKDAGGIQRALL